MLYKKIVPALLINLVMTSTFAASSFQNLIIFGDSLSDTGNNSWVKTEGKIGSPVTNQNTQGDSPLWISNLNALWFPGTTLYSSKEVAALQLNPYSQNINYAWSSAETGIEYLNDAAPNQAFPPYDDKNCDNGPGLMNPEISCVPGVKKQVELYLSDVNHKPNPKTLFIIWAGGNDLFNNMTKKILAPSSPDSDLNPSDPVNNILQAKNNLIASGVSAKQVYVLNMPDLAASPAAHVIAKDNPELLKLFHAMSVTFNVELKKALTHSANKIPESHVISTYDVFNAVLEKPVAFGFTNTNESCVANNEIPLCAGYIFFNDKHPSVKMGEVLAKQLNVLF